MQADQHKSVQTLTLHTDKKFFRASQLRKEKGVDTLLHILVAILLIKIRVQSDFSSNKVLKFFHKFSPILMTMRLATRGTVHWVITHTYILS